MKSQYEFPVKIALLLVIWLLWWWAIEATFDPILNLAIILRRDPADLPIYLDMQEDSRPKSNRQPSRLGDDPRPCWAGNLPGRAHHPRGDHPSGLERLAAAGAEGDRPGTGDPERRSFHADRGEPCPEGSWRALLPCPQPKSGHRLDVCLDAQPHGSRRHRPAVLPGDLVPVGNVPCLGNAPGYPGAALFYLFVRRTRNWSCAWGQPISSTAPGRRSCFPASRNNI